MTTTTAWAKEKCKSDKVQYQVLRQIPDSFAFSFPICDLLICEFDTQPVTDRTVVISENGTKSITVSHPQPLSAEFCGMSKNILQKVISRKPGAFQPYPDKEPKYIIAYVVETLECGHKKHVGFISEVEPLTAKRRVCEECSGASMPRGKRKPVQSVRPKLNEEVA